MDTPPLHHNMDNPPYPPTNLKHYSAGSIQHKVQEECSKRFIPQYFSSGRNMSMQQKLEVAQQHDE